MTKRRRGTSKGTTKRMVQSNGANSNAQNITVKLDQEESIDVSILDEPILSEPGMNRVNYLEELVSKQLNLYNWCEEKVSTLATMDSILLGAATLIADHIIIVGPEATKMNRVLNGVIIGLVLLPLIISLAISLWHIRPKMGKQSNTGTPSHRSSNGIRHFSNWEEYQKRLYSISDAEICNDLIKQIYGMNGNIWKNQKSIKAAVAFDLIGLLGFFVMMIIWIRS